MSMSRNVLFTVKSWYMIGFDDGQFRIKGGRTLYEAVMYNCARNGRLVKLARLVGGAAGVYEIRRYVSGDTLLEFVYSGDQEKQKLIDYLDEFDLKGKVQWATSVQTGS